MENLGNGQQQRNSLFQLSKLALAIYTVGIGSIALPLHSTYAATTNAKSYNISVGTLANVLNQFAEQSGTSIAIDAQQLKGKNSTGLKGSYSIEQGFQHILMNTEFYAVKVGQGYTLTKKAPPLTANQVASVSPMSDQRDSMNEASARLAPIVVYGQEDRDTQGYNKVYDANHSSVYAGKEYVERFKGTNPADVLQGMVGVYSGDARNSGALDPSVRGVQGVGRVPLTIDGTEQSVAVWRGYNGVNNRNYIDPNLIAGIEVIKGPSLERNATTSVGGGVLVKTLEADDIVHAGKTFGAELKVEGSTNSIDPSLPDMSKVGRDYSETTPWIEIDRARYDPDIYKKNRTRKDNSNFSGDDLAGRLALAMKQDQFDLLAVYAVRERGNYFSGTHGAGYYKRAEPNNDNFDFIPYFAHAYKPGDEVPNTSSQMESWLFKGTYRPTDFQTLKLTYRDTKNKFGEIMPSRIQWGITPDLGVPQWPLSDIRSKAYSLEYKFKPESNQWVDFYANVWQTDTESQTYTRGGWPTTIDFRDNKIINTAVSHSDNTRKGITVSNKAHLTDQLDLTLGGSFLKEKLTSDDVYGDHGSSYSLYQALPRAGRREEKTFDFNFNYRPLSWLSFDAGMRYRSYWAFDDFLNKSIRDGVDPTLNPLFTKKNRLKEYSFEYRTMPESYDAQQQRMINLLSQRYATSNPDWDGRLETVPASETNLYSRIWSQINTLTWKADPNGHLALADNILDQLNALDQKYVVIGNGFKPAVIEQVPIESVNKVKDSGWAPQLSAAIQLTENNRLYARYAEEYRLPSLFESTVGFSAMMPYQAVKPEHAFNYEVGYVYDMRDWFSSARNADFKLAYYYNKTKNVIERNQNLIFTNMDEQKLAGLELQSRFDNGAFFTDLSLAYNLKNEVCDSNSAIDRMINSGTVQTDHGIQFRDAYQRCVDDGFPNGYLVTMSTPELSAHALFGARFFDEALELGARATFYKAYESPLRKNNDDSVNKGYYLNVPLAWDDTWIFDAYARYQVDTYNTVEFVGNNLSNQFYIDPLTRSAMAAPGRTLKISWTTKF
ncbi:TonB-dependent receptor [Acinetobacter haemolyticus]|uniref:TonB-dependent receptor n=1 Tax=Acinetobacter haemolyticus TaxID=29430 RepID=UPI00325B8F4D